MSKFRDEYYGKRWAMSVGEWMDYMAHLPAKEQGRGITGYIKWMGICLKKTPVDMWLYQELMFEVKPDIFIEIGARFGGSTLFFAHMQQIIGNGRVISIDNSRIHYRARHPRIIELTGDSSSPEITSQAHCLCAGKTVMINHDGDHRKEQVLRDLKAYCDLVSVGSYFIVEDTHIDVWPLDHRLAYVPGGPLMAIREFLKTHPEFTIDQAPERYIATYCPRGFLKRVR